MRIWEFTLGARKEGTGVGSSNDSTHNRRFAATGATRLHEGQAQLGGHRHLIPRLLLAPLAVFRLWAAHAILIPLRPWLPTAEAQAG